jgi:hypothetical protein
MNVRGHEYVATTVFELVSQAISWNINTQIGLVRCD